MKLQAILTNPEIRKLIYNRYPITKMEKKGCEREKARLDFLRWAYGKRLYAEMPQAKKEYK